MFAQNHLIYDILIVGGGIVGLTFANLLAKSGLSIAIIEQGPQKISETNLSYDLRVSAITPASLKIFINKLAL